MIKLTTKFFRYYSKKKRSGHSRGQSKAQSFSASRLPAPSRRLDKEHDANFPRSLLPESLGIRV
jgi:hypothetical protein